ncbi:epidermal growth factor receptor kinase substrate 8-like protein 3b [Synchiropus splendidus]|uniref:epidermal growth factor receptor kinase substrate 8-like protein 3b n=1 Tax=Synchiropus splendidus TaxID=270530 RepID=UPI00237DE2A7|nr:epidermal growth factor receptor kinase substrate 8-like protein 3b [Synchiropus splendidus]
MFNGTPFSYTPRGIHADEPHVPRRSFRDNLRASSPQMNMSRPNGRNIYMQRKEYSDALNRQPNNFHFRVEHLFTCELDGQEVRTLEDCVAKLKRLDVKDRLWPQEMILEVHRGMLLLSDIETKSDLESLPLTSIQQTKAVLDSCAYNSLLTVTVKDRNHRFPQVYIFQCEEVGAALLKNDLDKIVHGLGDVEPYRQTPDIRRDLENIISHHTSGQRWSPSSPPPPVDLPQPPWDFRDQNVLVLPRVQTPHDYSMDDDDESLGPEVRPQQERMEMARNTMILNHILDDVELFMNKLAPMIKADLAKGKGKTKQNGQKRKNKKKADSVPPEAEFKACLQKVKYGLNLLAELEGTLENPTATEYIHIVFQLLGMMLPHYPRTVPSSVLSPLLTDRALQLLNDVVTPQEKELWSSLGDTWTFSRSSWQSSNIPPYIPEFSDGWQPPAPVLAPGTPMSRSNSRRFPVSRSSSQMNQSPPVSRGMPSDRVDGPRWSPSPPPQASEPPLFMRVIYDFMARNNQELSIMKGEVVEVVDKSRQWWLVRNNHGEEGSVPPKVLAQMEGSSPAQGMVRGHASEFSSPRQAPGAATLDMQSSPAAVKAWLQSKGFSRITVSSLGVLTGHSLLGMSKRDIQAVCPEEGGRVFFQLQAVKSSIALSSESSAYYNGRY